MDEERTLEPTQEGENPEEREGPSPEDLLREKDARIALLEEELDRARRALAHKEEEVASLRAELAVALERYRSALLASSPEVPPELVGGVFQEGPAGGGEDKAGGGGPVAGGAGAPRLLPKRTPQGFLKGVRGKLLSPKKFPPL